MFKTIRFRQVSLSDRLIASSASALTQLAESLDQDQVELILLDLSTISFIDSVGLGLLVSLQNKLRRQGIKLYLTIEQKQTHSLFELANVEQIFVIFQDYDEFYTQIVRNRLVLINS
jgi:anti-anti-sigma factor